MQRTAILGTGAYAPEKIITNKDLEKMVETSDEWIVKMTGIKERRMAAPEEAASDLSLKASIRALEMAKTRPEDLDLIIVGTVSGDMPFPSTAVFLQAKLGAKRAFAFDLSAACAGSIYALDVADQYVKSGKAKRVLVVGVEVLTRIVDWKDRKTCVLFGDAAGAMVLGPSEDPNRGIISTHMRSDGTMAEILCIKAGGSKLPISPEVLDQKLNKVFMNGPEVYKFAVRSLVEVTQEALAHNHLHPDQLNHVIAHQANIRILDAVLDRMSVPREKAWINIDKYGNTSSASLPTTLDEANRAGKLKPNDLIAMMAIGGGMAWGSAIVRW